VTKGYVLDSASRVRCRYWAEREHLAKARTSRPNGGRTWWAYFDFTRINLEPIILRKKIEDLREAGATLLIACAFIATDRPFAVRFLRSRGILI